QREILPRLSDLRNGDAAFTLLAHRAVEVTWSLGEGSRLALLANLGEVPLSGVRRPRGELLYASERHPPEEGSLPPWSVAWFLEPAT
ncbi:MAG: DUF3459 domain-containing protein, partial [Gammaproteobacteria bacterium]